MNVIAENSNIVLRLEMTPEEASQLKGLMFRASWSDDQFPWAGQVVDALEGITEAETSISAGEIILE